MAEETAVVLDNGFGDVYNVKAGANGVVSIENVLCQNYGIKVDGYLDGEINVVKGGTLGTVTLEYYFAHNAGDRADLVDLTDMNAENASITLGGQGENGVDQYSIAAQLKLSQEMKSARSYVCLLYTSLGFRKYGRGLRLEPRRRVAASGLGGDRGRLRNFEEKESLKENSRFPDAGLYSVGKIPAPENGRGYFDINRIK